MCLLFIPQPPDFARADVYRQRKVVERITLYMNIVQNPGRLLWLIVASLLFLGLSQVLWIKRVWDEQRDGLRQETSYIFQQTVLALQDSLVRKSMRKGVNKLDLDSTSKAAILTRMDFPPPPPNGMRGERVFIAHSKDLCEGDTFSEKMEKKVSVFIKTAEKQPLAVENGLSRVFLNISQNTSDTSETQLVFSFETDSISPETLQLRFATALSAESLPHNFELLKRDDPGFAPTNKMTTDPAMSGIMRRQFYVAEFQEYKGFLFLKILPYILFSFFLFGITSLAFWLIFNGLKKQQKLAEQKNEFISNVTHELKTPLTTVGVALEALDDFEVLRNPDKTREYLQISKMELERLNLLVDKVLRLSMFEQNALQMRPEWLDLAATTGQVIQAMSLQANAVGAVIRFDQQPCTLLGDKVHLTGVVYNLLDNALKYCGNNTEIDVSVRNLVKDDQCFARLEVRDNGIGIAPEYHQQVFEKFFRVPMGNVHNVKGHGLGLNYVSAVVRQHGGSIYVESQPGMGSAFIVEIPAPTPPPIA